MRLSKVFIVITFFSVSGVAVAFPANTRYGYANCSSCHVSPTGGGVLTPYGRMSSAELLSMEAKPNEEEILHGTVHNYISPDSPVSVGGDVRYLSLREEPRNGGSLQSQNFFMQREIEAAVNVTRELTLVASGGYYALGEHEFKAETRRNYALLNWNENLSVRAGRFFPAYGILLDDHTAATRSSLGWDEGQETYNVEVSYKNALGELFITPMLGSDNSTDLTADQGYVFRTDEKGVAGRLTAYLGKSSQVGISGLYRQVIIPDHPGYRVYYGAFGIFGFTPTLYALTELDAVQANDIQTRQIYSYNQLGYEFHKGLHAQAGYQRRGAEDEYSGTLQWFPRPHYELRATYSRSRTTDTILFLLHYYL